MKVINSKVTFDRISKYSKLQLAIAKLFKIPIAHRYIMEARFKLSPSDKLHLMEDVIDNCGNEWYVVSRNPTTNEYMLKSGNTIHECDGHYSLTHVSVI